VATIKINEQIAFLRHQKDITQEELAQALGVTNQSVSKWESGICCPDIQLLPDIAAYFGVTVDELMGYKPADTSKDIILQLRSIIEELPKGEDFSYTIRMAAALHAIILSKSMTAEPNPNTGWDTDEAIKHAGTFEWGYSCCNVPEITTVMRRSSVFFSNNKDLNLSDFIIRKISQLLKTFSDIKNLKVIISLYMLTIHSENAYVSPSEVSKECGLTENIVTECLSNGLLPYLTEKNDNNKILYRIEGMNMYLVPLFSMFSFN
jgi:transcriptional regulator with XRE-family HTH domain